MRPVSVKQRVGQLPATLVLLSLLLIAAFGAVLFDQGTGRTVIGLVLLAILLTYCWARPEDGIDVFWIAAIPNAAATLLHDVAGAPSWIGFVFIPIALWFARDLDRDSSVPATAHD